MATIENATLTLTETSGQATAVVNYRLRGSPQDVQQNRIYRELVELIGVDEGPGEDGQNELIPGGPVFVGFVVFQNTNAIVRPPRTLIVPTSAIDEDRFPAPFGGFPLRDEIRARVTLVQLAVAPVSANTNTIFRGESVLAPV